jgi:hypothetical protein
MPLGVPTTSPIADPDNGAVTLSWLQFFISLWTRTGSGPGNNSSIFPFPDNSGQPGQALVSQGAGKLAIWQTLATKLSQFTNDVGFITSAALVGLSTPETTQAQIDNSNLSNLSNDTPVADSRSGFAGLSTKVSRADHSHIRETNPTYNTVGAVTSVSTPVINLGLTSLTSGVGIPVNGSLPNGSLYLRADGQLNARMYVSDGAVWRAVAGV